MMKMKVLTLTLVFGLLLTLITCINGSTNAKVKHEHHGAAINVETKIENNPNVKQSSNHSALTKRVKYILKDKGLRKRGVIHYGDLDAPQVLNIWPHYGYKQPINAPSNFQPWTAALVRIPSVRLSAPIPLLPAVTPFNQDVSGFRHQSHSTLPSSYVLRPGSAGVQAFNINYPHHNTLLATEAAKSIHGLTVVHPIQQLHPIDSVPSLSSYYPLQNSFNPTIHPEKPSVIHPHTALQPITPSVVQVHEVPNVVSCNPPAVHQYYPHLFQTSFGPSSVPAASPMTTPTTFTNPPQFPSPSIPTVPTIPLLPEVPTIPNIPHIPQRPNSFLPGSVQPLLPQQPPTFVTTSGNPLIGNADASPQIPPPPSHPLPPAISIPELNPQPATPSEIWRPTVQQQHPTILTLHPSHTLLPPLNNSVGEAYLPPEHNTSLPNKKLQQTLHLNSELFDGLSNAEIEHIFNQANLAAQNDNQNHHKHAHTVHTYHSQR